MVPNLHRAKTVSKHLQEPETVPKFNLRKIKELQPDGMARDRSEMQDRRATKIMARPECLQAIDFIGQQLLSAHLLSGRPNLFGLVRIRPDF